MAGDLGFQMDMFGPIYEAITVASSTPVIAANGGWQMAETAAFVAALRRGSLTESLGVINRLKLDTAWKVLLEAGFTVGTSTDRATMMAPVQKDMIEAAQRLMTGHELRMSRERESAPAIAQPTEAHEQVAVRDADRPIEGEAKLSVERLNGELESLADAEPFSPEMDRLIEVKKLLAKALAAEETEGLVLAKTGYGNQAMGAMISQEPDDSGQWRISWFDERGFSGDGQRATKEAAILDALQDGYRDTNRQLLDQMAALESFHAGNEATRKIQEANARMGQKQAGARQPVTPTNETTGGQRALYMPSLDGVFVEGTSQEVPQGWSGVALDGENPQGGFVYINQARVVRRLAALEFGAAVHEARQYGGAEVQVGFQAAEQTAPGPQPERVPAVSSEDHDRVYTLEEHGQVAKAIRAGDLTADQMKATFARFMRDKEPLRAELSAKTLKELAPGGAGGMRKAEVVDRILSNMMGRFTLSQSITWTMGRGSYEQAVAEKVNALTDQDLKQYAEEIRQSAAERSAAIEDMKKAAENPETLEDFRTYIRLKKNEGLSFDEARMSLVPEQRATFDELTAEESRSSRINSAEARKSEVRVAAQTTAGQVLETKHTRTGEPLFVVQAAERVERDVYNEWNGAAKKLGGWYSSFRGNGAVPGFQFKNRESAEAFVKYLGGEIEDAQEVAQARRDAFADDRSQTAVERLREMAGRLEEQADASLGQERKANTERRARMAASAEASANGDKAMAHTMRNVADGIETGSAKYLDRVRQKVQVEMLASMVRAAHDVEQRKKYPSYADQQAHRGEPPTAETADYVRFPEFTAYRSDLARLGRELVQIDGAKLVGQRLLKVADDISDVFKKFAKDNLLQVSTIRTADGQPAIFGTEDRAEAAIARSGLKGKAAVVSFKRGEHRVIMGPEMAREKGLWQGDDDKRITLTGEFGEEIVAKFRSLGKANRISMPHIFESVSLNRGRLKAMGIETPAELRAAVREYVSFSVAPARADRVKELERAMVGRRNDGLDFFPTGPEAGQQAIDAAEIEPWMSVYEPSAGWGHLAELIRAAGVEPDVGEISPDRRALLEAKGFKVISGDFLQMRLEDTPGGQGYDRIIMNPPFSDRRDAEHVQHAYSLLKPKGRLVSIMGEGVFFGQDKRAQASREWIESLGGSSEKLPEGSFLDPSLPVNTGVSARLVVIDRGETQEIGQSVDAAHVVDAPLASVTDGVELQQAGTHVENKSPFMSQEEAQTATQFLGSDESLFGTRPTFGSAGGPDEVHLTEAGLVRAYDLASVYRFKLGIDHIRALEHVAAGGEAGVPMRGLARDLYAVANELSRASLTDFSQASIAASLTGDNTEYERLREANRLVYLDQTGETDHWRITSLGTDLVRSANAVSVALREARTQMSLSAEPSIESDGKSRAAQEERKPTSKPVTPQIPGGDMERFIKVAADSIQALRKVDVFRVLVESNRVEYRLAIADYIREKRPDLVGEVNTVLEEERAHEAVKASMATEAPVPVSTGVHIGRVIAIDKACLVQKTGRTDDDIAVHALTALDHLPAVGEMVNVAYAGGKGAVRGMQPQHERGNTR